MERTAGTLLGGRVHYAQPRTGFRSGIEPVLLAAFVPARPGETVIEGGCGAGAGLLCLAARVPALRGLGVERDPELAALARDNLAANGFAGVDVMTGDITAHSFPPPLAGGAGGGAEPQGPRWRANHAFANPPYHPPGGTASPDSAREAAKRAEPGLIAAWARALAAPLRPGGTLSLVLPAAALAEGCAALTATACAPSVLFPLWPRAGQAAKLVLLQGIKEGRGGTKVMPGLVLHRPDGGFTEAAEAALRDGAGL